MKHRYIQTISIIFMFSCSSAFPEGIRIEELFKAAAKKDTALKIIESEQRVDFLNERIEDYTEGFKLGLGTGENGINIFESEDTNERTLEGSPTVSLDLPENTGTSFEVSVPLQTTPWADIPAMYSVGLKVKQNLNRLFGWKKQNLRKIAERESSRFSMKNRFFQRRLEVERNLLIFLKSLMEVKKEIISNQALLYEKKANLEYMLKEGMILRNGSSHLSRLMEIRQLQSEINESEISASEQRNRIESLTGIFLDKIPEIPEVRIPLMDNVVPEKIHSAELSNWEVLKLRAELSDFKAPTPVIWDLTAKVNQSISSPLEKSFSIETSGKTENLSLGLTAGYSNKEKINLEIFIDFSPHSMEKNNIREKILNEKVYIARQNLIDEILRGRKAIRSLRQKNSRLENREKYLLSNRDFLKEYMLEMEEKYRKGLIQKMEITKAREQNKIFKIDWEILNIEKYLLKNGIESLIGNGE